MSKPQKVYCIYARNFYKDQNDIYLGCADEYHLMNSLRHIQAVCDYSDNDMQENIIIRDHIVNHTVI